MLNQCEEIVLERMNVSEIMRNTIDSFLSFQISNIGLCAVQVLEIRNCLRKIMTLFKLA